MQKIGIIGAGVMGLGIAQVAVQNGLEVVLFDLFDRRPGSLKTSQNKLRQALYLEKNKDGKRLYSFEEADVVFSRARFLEITQENLRALRGCDAVIEAIIEDIEAKRKLYQTLESAEENYINIDTPIFSNTSTVQIERLAQGMQNPERFMGLHFFNPVPVMRLIEAIPHRGTSQAIMDFAEKQLSPLLGKMYRLAPDIPGFIANRLAVPMIRAYNREIGNGTVVREIDLAFKNGCWPNFPAARRIVEEFVESAAMIFRDQNKSRVQLNKQQIDEIAILGLNFPFGPFALGDALAQNKAAGIKFPMGPGRFCDLVGIDVAVDCCRMLELQEPGRWPTPPILEKMVADGMLGKKSGCGFYDDYEGNVRVRRIGKYAHVSYGGDVLSLSLVQKLTETFEKLGKEEFYAILFEIRAKGANLKEFPLCLKDRQNAGDAIETWHKYIRALRECPVPVTALIRDQALGGGYESALACDMIIATKGARIGLPEVGLGIMPGGGGTQNLTRRVGLGRGTEMILGAKVIIAKKPFVDMIVPTYDPKYILEPDEIVHLVRFGASKKLTRIAHTVGAVEYAKWRVALIKVRIGWLLKGLRLPASFLLAIDAIWDGYQTDIEDGMWFELFEILRAFDTEDAREGISASPVFEKRKPRFTGK